MIASERSHQDLSEKIVNISYPVNILYNSVTVPVFKK